MKYPLFKVHVDVEDAMSRLRDVLESGYLNEGRQVLELQEKLGQYFGTKNLVMLNSCTSALTLAIKLACGNVLNVPKDVITTSMTCVATNAPVVTLGHKIVWADVDPWTGTIDPIDAKRKISSNTAAIIAVAWSGIPPKLDELRKICDDHDLALILDAAHAFGSKFDQKHVHEYADFTCYSMQAIKHVTSGDGGFLVCKDDGEFYRAKCLKWFGLDRDRMKDENGDWRGQQWSADIIEAGFKFNMNNVSAAIGLSQLKHVEFIETRHKENAASLLKFFKNNTVPLTPLFIPSQADPNYWVYTVRCGWANATLEECDELVEKLNEAGIGAGIVHVPNHRYECFHECYEQLQNTDKFANTQFSLPCGWWLNNDDVNDMTKIIENVFASLKFGGDDATKRK